MVEKLKAFYAALPKEVKVALYLLASYGVAELVLFLSSYKTENYYVVALINVALVFLVELKSRLAKRKAAKKKK